MSMMNRGRSLATVALDNLSGKQGIRLAAFWASALIGSLLIAASAKIQVPFWPVPTTLQTFAILALAAAAGTRLALATVLLYLAEGFAGAPVFAGAAAGPAYFAGPTAGYLAGFVAIAAIVGWAADKGWSQNPLRIAGAMIAAEAVLFCMGAAWLAMSLGVSPSKAYELGVQPFLLADAVKIGLAACFVSGVWRWGSRG